MNNIVTIEAWNSYKASKESELIRLKQEHKTINDKLTKKLSDIEFKELMYEQHVISLKILIVENNIKASKLSLKNFILSEKITEAVKDLNLFRESIN